MADTSATWSPQHGNLAKPLPSSPADAQRARIAKTAADATAALQQLTRDFEASPDVRVERLEREIEMLARAEGNGAATRRANVQSELITAKNEQKAQSVVLTDEQRVDLAMAGKVDHNGAQTTVDGQVRAEDFVAAVQDDLALGVRPALVETYHKTGKTDDPMGHVAAEFWMDMFRNDREMQRKFNEGDTTMRRRFRIASMYIAGKRGEVDPAEEARYRARLTRGDN